MDDFEKISIKMLIRSLEHQLAGPLVTAGGYMEMIADKKLNISGPAREKMALQSHQAIERSLDMLAMLTQLRQLLDQPLKRISSILRFDVLNSNDELPTSGGAELINFKIDRSYRLPAVLVDPLLFEEAVLSIANFLVMSTQKQVAITFRSRENELVVKLSSDHDLRPWLDQYRAYEQFLQTNYQLADTTNPVIYLLIAKLQLAKMDCRLNFSQIRHNPAALYIHAPKANQLSLLARR